MLSRENLKLAVVAVFCLLLAWTGPSIAHGVHAKFAHNADKVDGKHAVGAGASLNNAKGKLVAHDRQGTLPDKFVGKPNQVVTTHAAAAWRGSTVTNHDSESWATAGIAWMPLHAPHSLGGAEYGLGKVEICYNATSSPVHITATFGNSTEKTTDRLLFDDSTNRISTTSTCYTIPVGKRVHYGAAITVFVEGTGTMILRGVRTTWTRAAAKVAPRDSGRRSQLPD